jgi:hypothetical protein
MVGRSIQSFNNSNFKNNPTAAGHGGKEYIPPWAAALPQRLLTVQNRAQVHRKPTGDLVPFSPRRVLPRFVNPRIGSKLLGFSI